MQRIHIYRVLFLSTALLTPAVFFLEFYPLDLNQIAQKPYALPYLPAFHLIPEILCLFFFTLLVTAVAESCLDKHPETMTRIKYALLLSTFLFGSVVLILYLVVIEDLAPMAFQGFVWNLPVLLGYLIERKVISHAETSS